MASGEAFYDACCQFLGQPYSIAPGRTDPNSGHKDCSGMVAAGYQVAQGHALGAYVTVTIFDLCVNAGLEIPYADAVGLVGAVIFKPDDPMRGWGSDGHIAVSDGHGGTVEATPPSVQRLPLAYNAPWSARAALLPGIDYSNNGAGGPSAAAGKGGVMWWAVILDDNGFPRTFRMAGWLKLDELGASAPRGAFGIHQEALDSGWPISRLDEVFVLPGITSWDHVNAANDTLWG